MDLVNVRLASMTSAMSLVCAFCMASASAQSLDEVVVEARQRPEAAMTVPLSLRVLERPTIEAARIDEISDLAARTPGLVIGDPFGRYNPSPALRGLIQPGLGDEPNVGVFIDGIYVSGRGILNQRYLDLERIEVVRGPQSALYGRNTFGGAVNLVTRAPGDDPEADAIVTVGSEGRLTLQGSVGGPVIEDILSARLIALHDQDDGYFDNRVAGGPDIGAEETRALTGTLHLTPTEALSLTLRGSYIQDDDRQPKSHVVAANCAPDLTTGANRYFCGQVPTEGGDLAANALHHGVERDMVRLSGVLRADLTDDLRLESRTAHMTETTTFGFDGDYTPAVLFDSAQDRDSQDYSQDLRVLGEGEGVLGPWLLGGSYYRFDLTTSRNNIFFVSGQTAPTGLPRTRAKTETWAMYGSADWVFGPAWTLTTELRFLEEDKRFRTTDVDQTGNPLDLSESWDAWLPRAVLRWTMDEDLMVYASVAKGFKAGGFNDMANVFDSERAYDPDENWTYEFGSKATVWGGKAQLTGAVFHVDWSDQQIVAASAAGTNNNFYTANAADSASTGVEFEVRAQPLDGLTVDAGYTYTFARFEDYADPDLVNVQGFAPDGDVSGNRLPRQSAHQANLTAAYEVPLGLTGRWSDLKGALGGDLLYQSSQYSTPANLASTGPDTTVNLRAGLVDRNDDGRGVDITFWVDNVLDDDTAEVAIRWFDPAAGFGRAWLITPKDGRRYGMTLRMGL